MSNLIENFTTKIETEFENRKHMYVDECFPIEAVRAIIKQCIKDAKELT